MWLTSPERRAQGTSLRAVLAVTLAVTLMALPQPPAAAEPGSPRMELLALGGFDPVSYALEGGPTAGSARFEAAWGGRVWRFAGAANRAAFAADPEVYAPRLGGHDAAGILDGRLVDADPTVFARIGERLYLFRDPERRARFLADPGLARAAEAAWPGLRGLVETPD